MHSEHLHYEVIMLVGTLQELDSMPRDPSIARNAITESFAIHTRVLRQFFFGDGKSSDTVRAGDFSASWLSLANETPLISKAKAQR